MPIIEFWEGKANYSFDWAFLFPSNGLAQFQVRDLSINFALSISKGSRGLWAPILHNVDVDLGKTKLDVEDAFWSWLINQIIVLGKVLLENSLNLFGTLVVSASAGTIIE